MSRGKHCRQLGLSACLAVTLLALSCAQTEVGSGQAAALLRSSGKVSDRFPNILLWNQHNEPVRFYDDLVKDKTVIVNFMYSNCTDR